MIEVVDQLNHTVRLDKLPRRIVSLVPSQTEFLSYLGLDKEVVGITKFCVHPQEWYRSKKRVGGTKTVDLDIIRELSPDLIIANKEENDKETVQLLRAEFNVYVSDIYTFEDVYDMMIQLGRLTGNELKVEELVYQIKREILDIPKFTGKVLYFIWEKPYMVAGPNTFIGHVLAWLDFENAIVEQDARYVELDEEMIRELSPDYLLLSSEPYPFKQEQKEKIEKTTQIKAELVDGEIFSWYGSGMLRMKHYFTQLKKEFQK